MAIESKGRKKFQGKGFRNQADPYEVNEKIRAREVRLVGDNVEPGVYDTRKALRIAEKLDLDLVQISTKTVPPVCKITDYSKFKYEQKKKEKLIKSKAQKVVLKEIRFSPNTDDHDFEFKLRHAKKFLKENAKLKVTLKFSGREVMFKERGELLLLRFAQALEDIGKVDTLPKLEGKRMILMVVPKK